MKRGLKLKAKAKIAPYIALLLAIIACAISFIFDSRVLDFFKGIQNFYLTYLLYMFRPWLVYFALIVLVIAFLMMHKRTKAAVTLFAVSVFSAAMAIVIKFIFQRARPFGIEETLPMINLPDYSFPSSHALVVFALLPFMNKEFPRFRWLWILIAVLTAFSRLYYLEHYLSDVIAGALIGLLAGILMLKIEKTRLLKKLR